MGGYSSEDTLSASQLHRGLAPWPVSSHPSLLFPEKLMLVGHGRTSTQHPGFCECFEIDFYFFFVSVCVLVSAAAWMS